MFGVRQVASVVGMVQVVGDVDMKSSCSKCLLTEKPARIVPNMHMPMPGTTGPYTASVLRVSRCALTQTRHNLHCGMEALTYPSVRGRHVRGVGRVHISFMIISRDSGLNKTSQTVNTGSPNSGPASVRLVQKTQQLHTTKHSINTSVCASVATSTKMYLPQDRHMKIRTSR